MSAVPPTRMRPQAATDPLQRFLEARVREGRMPAAAWFVQGAKQVASRGAIGWAVIEPQRETVSEATPFDLASLTKPLDGPMFMGSRRRVLGGPGPDVKGEGGRRDGPRESCGSQPSGTICSAR